MAKTSIWSDLIKQCMVIHSSKLRLSSYSRETTYVRRSSVDTKHHLSATILPIWIIQLLTC